MKVVVDKNTINRIDKSKYELIYVFDNEALEDLLKLDIYCINKHYIEALEDVDINLTKYDVVCKKKANIEDKDWDNIPEVRDYKIGIIIPNCNYEEWLEKSIGSVLKQTYTNYQIIFVDDCSKDDSVEIAKKLLKAPHKVIELKQKRLNGGARNEAYLHLDDDVDYVMYVDSDDWLLNENALKIINDNLQGNPDVLFIGMSAYKNGNTEEIFEPRYKDRYDAMIGWSGSCGKIIRKGLATSKDCLYAEGTLKEDRNQHRRVCIKMDNFRLLKKPLYVWNRTNTKSVTTVRDNVIWKTSTIRQYADTLQLALEVKGQDENVDRIMEEAVKMCKKEMENGGDRQW